jgi:hypothetical protein
VVGSVLADEDVPGGGDRDVVDPTQRRVRPDGIRLVEDVQPRAGDPEGPDAPVPLGREVDDPLVEPCALAAVEVRRSGHLLPGRLQRAAQRVRNLDPAERSRKGVPLRVDRPDRELEQP